MTSYSQIIPDNLQSILIQLGDEIEGREWTIGDLAVELTAELPNPAHEVYSAMAFFLKSEARTVEDMAYTARNVPHEIRGWYDQLGRHHFRAVIPHAKSDLGLWLSYLECWLSETDTSSVASLRQFLNGSPTERIWQERLRYACSALRRLAYDKRAPAEVRACLFRVLYQIREHAGGVDGI